MKAPNRDPHARTRGVERDGPDPEPRFGFYRWGTGIALVAALALVVGLAALLLGTWQSDDRRHAEAAFIERADLAASQVETVIMGSVPQLADALEREARSGPIGRGALARGTRGSVSAWAVDGRGDVIVRSKGAEGRPEAAELQAIDAGESRISGVERHSDGTRIIRIAVPVESSGPVAGAVAGFPVALTSSFIRDAIERIPLTAGSRVAIFDTGGEALPAPGLDSTQLQMLSNSALRDRTGELELTGTTRRFASAAVPGTPWVVVLAAPRSEVVGSMSGGMAWLGWGALAAFALTGLIGIFLMMRVLADARRMAEINRRLEQREREAQRATHAKNEFISSMAHELRTPLAAIRMFADLLKEDEADPLSPHQRRSLDDISASTRHMLDLLDDTMDIARVESGRLNLRPERISAAALAIGVVDGLHPLATQRGINLTLEANGSVGEVYLDPARLRQIVINLLSNALKFTERGGEVVLRLSRHGPASFVISVEDTGVGIAPDDIPDVFSSMKRISRPIHEQDSNRGLGLALTKRIVEAMGGHVGLESREGVGSTFYAVLPRVNAGRRAGVDPTTSARQGSFLTDPAPARGAVDRQFSALGVRSETDPGHNYGRSDVGAVNEEADSRSGVERPDPGLDPDPHPGEKGAESSE